MARRLAWLAIEVMTVGVLLLRSSTAWAWDQITLWYAPASGPLAGGGGLIGTGGQGDFTVSCSHCHTNAEKKINATITATPSFGGGTSFVPGQSYAVSVKLENEHLGLSGCAAGTTNNNGFAATFEDDAGRVVGTLASDSGQSQDSCPSSAPMGGQVTGTTVMYGDCRAVLSKTDGAQTSNETEWRFGWTAPSSASGGVNLFVGVVDGDCKQDSLGDDVKMVKLMLSQAAVPPTGTRGKPWRFMLAAAIAALAVAAWWRAARRVPARAWLAAGAILPLCIASGCATVPPYARAQLARRCMALAANPQASEMEQHVFEYREGASGATGVVGGGCGCN